MQLNVMLICFSVVSQALDHYIRAVTVCNSLALLFSQGSPEDFIMRIAVLTALQKCWLNGHLILKLECSSDGAINCISEEILHDLSTRITSDPGICFTDDTRNLSDFDPAEQCDNIDNVEASSDFVELKSEFLDESESSEQKPLVPTDGI